MSLHPIHAFTSWVSEAIAQYRGKLAKSIDDYFAGWEDDSCTHRLRPATLIFSFVGRTRVWWCQSTQTLQNECLSPGQTRQSPTSATDVSEEV